MFTFEELFNAAIAKGFKVEAYSYVFDRWGDRDGEETILSISNKDAIWFTWVGSIITDNEPLMFFHGRYNQNNGATQRTYKKENNMLFDLGLRSIK